MSSCSIGFVGGGRITRVMLEAWQRAGLDADMVVADPDPAVREALQARFPDVQVTPHNHLAARQSLLLLALHPPVMKTVLPELSAHLSPECTVLSLAPVLTFVGLGSLLGGHGRLVRMIPNAPSMIGKGFNPMAYGPGATDVDRGRLGALLGPMGSCPEVPEKDLEAYAVLAAMGPTYFWFQWQALRELGGTFGLDGKHTDEALKAMLEGAVELQFASGIPFEAVVDTVPVKPLGEDQETILAPFRTRLPPLHARLSGKTAPTPVV